MLQAKLNNGALLTLIHRNRKEIDHLKKAGKYFCPTCNEPVFIKAGDKMIPHFAHYSNSACPSNERGEGKYHEQGKLLLYQWLNSQGMDVRLEEYIPSIQQRPDVLLKINKKQIAIEYQCARISTEEIRNRNRGYRSIGIIPIWILGANRLERKTKQHIKIDSFAQNFIHQYTSNSPSVIYYFCPETLRFIIMQDIIFTRNGHAIGKLKIVDIRNLHFKDLFILDYLGSSTLYANWKKEKERFRLQPRKQVYGMELEWRQWLYLKRMHIENLPSIIYLPVSTQYRLKTNLWDWQSRICLDILDPIRIGGVVSFQRIAYHVRKYLKSPTLFPLIRSEEHPIKEYLQILIQIGILTELLDERYQKLKPLTYYQHIEEAMKGDEVLIQQLMKR